MASRRVSMRVTGASDIGQQSEEIKDLNQWDQHKLGL